MTANNLNDDWWKQAVVYQIYPRSFKDVNGDGLGDIAGVTEKMDYLKNLGVDAIWLSPFYPSDLADGGYDVIDYRNVDPRLGTMDDFDAMAEAAHEAGMSVMVDAKRNDIGATAEAYATSYLGKTQLPAGEARAFEGDFVTVNAYLGVDGVKPFVNACEKNGGGIFALVKTSNPSSGQLQDMKLEDGRTVYEMMGDLVSEWGESTIGRHGYSQVGAVVGATYPEQGRELRARMKHTFFLVPGYGAQGGTAEDLRHCFNEDGLGAVVNSSRGIIAAYKQEKYREFGPERFGEASRQAVKDMVADINRVL